MTTACRGTSTGTEMISQSTPAVKFEMAVLATGGSFRERTEFEAEGGTLRFRFDDDGTFEFEDADGEGEGTYGIVELNAGDRQSPLEAWTLWMTV